MTGHVKCGATTPQKVQVALVARIFRNRWFAFLEPSNHAGLNIHKPNKHIPCTLCYFNS